MVWVTIPVYRVMHPPIPSLLEIIARVPDRLTPELLTAAREALGHAAWSIFRHNVTLPNL
jgi:hypothetical protein